MKPTIFDKSRIGASGHTISDPEFSNEIPSEFFDASIIRNKSLGLPELTEIEVVRHYTHLSLENHGVDSGTYPLGSCTMKYNPKRNDAAANLSGFRNIHPNQPEGTIPGLWEMMHGLQGYISELMGMDAVSLQPAAGAHGELAGLLIIRKYFETKKKNVRLF